MVKAHELAQTLRARSAERRVKADARAARLCARLPQASKLAVEGMPSASYFHALADLMALFGGPVDLVRTEEATASLRAHIEEEGQPL